MKAKLQNDRVLYLQKITTYCVLHTYTHNTHNHETWTEETQRMHGSGCLWGGGATRMGTQETWAIHICNIFFLKHVKKIWLNNLLNQNDRNMSLCCTRGNISSVLNYGNPDAQLPGFTSHLCHSFSGWCWQVS